MTVEITKLENGLTIVTDSMPHLMSAALGVWVGCGARYERKPEMGISHMIEHMAFKGTARRSAKDIATEIEAVGGELNAYTAREQTAFHARVLKEDVGLALDILADILINPAFDGNEIEREREVILQEIGQTRDTPDDLIFDHLQEACYPGQPMGWPIFGNEETVGAFSRDDLTSYMGGNYGTNAMLLIGAGAVDHAAFVEASARLFAAMPKGASREPLPARFSGKDLRDSQDLEQAHLAFAFPSVSARDPEAMTSHIFATALGGGMSSRLFQEAREKRGLCYAISAFAAAQSDTGMLAIYAGTGEKEAGEIAPLIAAEMEAMAIGATEEEVARARAQLTASLLMGFESPASRCERIAGHLFTFGRVLSSAESRARIEAVDGARVRRFAERVCATGGPAIAAVGPVGRLESREVFARRFGRAPALAP